MEHLDHKHLLLKAWVKNPPTSEALLEKWLAEVVEAIKMKIVIPPRAVYVGTAGNEGLTGSVNIETSHIAIHVWDKLSPALIQMDVYSCATFNPKQVVDKLNEFELVKYEQMVVDRNRSFMVTDHIRVKKEDEK